MGKIGWLNGAGGFENSISYNKVAEAAVAAGADMHVVMKALEELEQNKDEINDATAYVCKTIRSTAGGKGRSNASSGQSNSKPLTAPRRLVLGGKVPVKKTVSKRYGK